MKFTINIEHRSSIENTCLQAVDLFCWGIARRYNDNNIMWFECFKDKVKYDIILTGRLVEPIKPISQDSYTSAMDESIKGTVQEALPTN